MLLGIRRNAATSVVVITSAAVRGPLGVTPFIIRRGCKSWQRAVTFGSAMRISSVTGGPGAGSELREWALDNAARARYGRAPFRCVRCGRLDDGALYIEDRGSRLGRPICRDCDSRVSLEREWTRRERWLWGVSTPKDPERKRVRCAVCRRHIYRPTTAPWKHAWPEVCSRSCRREQRKAERQVRHEPRACIACGRTFQPRRSDAKACSGRCRTRLHRQRQARAETP